MGRVQRAGTVSTVVSALRHGAQWCVCAPGNKSVRCGGVSKI